MVYVLLKVLLKTFSSMFTLVYLLEFRRNCICLDIW